MQVPPNFWEIMYGIHFGWETIDGDYDEPAAFDTRTTIKNGEPGALPPVDNKIMHSSPKLQGVRG